VIWLLRHLKTDFKTIADFRRDNCKAFRPVFRQFVLLCRQLDLFGRELLAIDGTRIKAVNNKDRNFTRAWLTEFIKLADARLDDYLQWLDQADITEGATGGSRVKTNTPCSSRRVQSEGTSTRVHTIGLTPSNHTLICTITVAFVADGMGFSAGRGCCGRRVIPKDYCHSSRPCRAPHRSSCSRILAVADRSPVPLPRLGPFPADRRRPEPCGLRERRSGLETDRTARSVIPAFRFRNHRKRDDRSTRSIMWAAARVVNG
jgi:hypothetical protein